MRRGFTLIEVLVAIVLVAVVLPVAIAGISAAVQASGQVRQRDLAWHLAEGQLGRLVATGTWSSSAQAGDFDPAQDGESAAGFHWQLVVSSWRDPAVSLLHMTVSWDRPGDGHFVALDTLATPLATGTTGATGAAAGAAP